MDGAARGVQPGEPGPGTDLTRFHEGFFEEAAEHLQAMERMLVALDGGAAVPDETLHAIFRVAHSIKGGAATFGFDAVTRLAHELETLLDRLRRHEIGVDAEVVELLLRACDGLGAVLARCRAGAPVEPDAALVQALRRRAGGTPPERATPAGAREPAQEPVADAQARDLELRVGPFADPEGEGSAADRLHELFEEIPGLGRIRPLDFGKPVDGMRRFHVRTACADGELADLCTFHVDRAHLQILPLGPGYGFHAGNPGAPLPAGPATARGPAGDAEASGGPDTTTLRVSLAKIDQLINLVGEMVIAQAMLVQGGRGLDPVAHQPLLGAIAALERNSRDLQDAVMSIRMIPMSVVFSRFPRMLRDLARQLGRQVTLVTHGEATELDKGLIEKITDPLTHLVRNACDHGIEPVAERLAAGKPPAGTITLSAWHQGGSIVIEVRDDGRGLSRPRLLAKARERGLEAPDTLTDAEVWQLIFEPGFSTAEVVSDVSGRGVGMDVVRRNILALGGQVELEAQPGAGMGVKVRLPLTLAIMDGMSVAVGEETYILPVASVIECDRLAGAALRSIGGAGRMVRIRDDHLAALDLAELLDVPVAPGREPSILVVVESEGRRAALLVDELVGQQQVVVKNLETHYRRVPDVSGATILGNGRVALILDVAALVRRRGGAGRTGGRS